VTDRELARREFVSDIASDMLMADWARRYGSELLAALEQAERERREARTAANNWKLTAEDEHSRAEQAEAKADKLANALIALIVQPGGESTWKDQARQALAEYEQS